MLLTRLSVKNYGKFSKLNKNEYTKKIELFKILDKQLIRKSKFRGFSD